MDLTVRPITESEVGTFRRRMSRGFGADLKDEDNSRFLQAIDLKRTIAAFDGNDLIGTCAAFTFDVTVPGGALPMGGTTMITVQATHRRRGVLRAMMRAHLDEVRDRGEPLSGLWASETSIYGRFGYGLAAEGYVTRLSANTIQFIGDPPEGAVTLVESDDAKAFLPQVYERVRPTRPGMMTRSDARWKTEFFYDSEHHREGRTAKRFAIFHGATGPEGYAIYRQKEKWEDFPDGEVYVLELIAATPESHEGLWRFLSSIDLFPNVRYWNAPVDDELPWRVTEPRRIQRTIGDSLWVRLMDIPKALAGRSYREAGRLVLEVRDPFLPHNDGTYELEASPRSASCRRCDREPDLELDVDVLAAIYLGGHRITTLSRAGLVRGTDDALATASRLFPWDPAPWCPENF